MPYPRVIFPESALISEWNQHRVIKAAEKFIGIPYAHHHIPEVGGLDCSNFTALVYNYAFGIRFSSNIKRQSQEAGRRLETNESLMPGDLIFLFDQSRTEISHVAIFLNKTQVIDSSGVGVRIRPFAGRYKERFAWARRILE